ncbi:MAG: hypothetical protein AB9866_03055 [Syntrophobacteraceae bacterium]
MRYPRTGIVALCLVILAISAVTASAGESMAFRQGSMVTVDANGCAWKKCAFVPIEVPGRGFVIVTASGMASFTSNAVLELTLGTVSAAKGAWQYWVTAAEPMTSYQSFTVRRVFKVFDPKVYNFFLNGRACDNPAGSMHVEVGSITAEFYPEAAGDSSPEPKAKQPLESGVRPPR